MKQWAIGVDLGGTKIEVALVDSGGIIKDRLRIATESHKGPGIVIRNIINTIHNLCSQNPAVDYTAIGVGVAGQIEKKSGVVLFAPNLNWQKVKLQAILSAKLKKPVIVCNDVKAATWGEWLHGSGKGCADMVCIFVGTGIGGGIVSGGSLLGGCNNSAGEIGHMTIDLNGPQCHCGNAGCFEALAGGWAIERDAREAIRKNKQAGKMLLTLAGGDMNAVTGKTVIEAALKKDALSVQITDHVADALIAGSVSIVNSLDPCRIIFGGGVIEGMPQLITKIKKGVKKKALKAATESLQVLGAKLHNDSGVIGAAALAMNSSYQG